MQPRPYIRVDGDEVLRYGEGNLAAAGTDWRIAVESLSGGGATQDISLCAEVNVGESSPCSVGLEFLFDDWSRDAYLLMPGSVYNGNRFKSEGQCYPPKMPLVDSRPDCETVVSDIKRLAIGESESRIELLAGDLAMPVCAVLLPQHKLARIILASDAVAEFGELGFDIEENDARSHLAVRLMLPGFRNMRYDFYDNHIKRDGKSDDAGRVFRAGERLDISLKYYEFSCETVSDLFEKLFELRWQWSGEPPVELPFSASAGLVEDHYNRDLWWSEAGLYKVAAGDGNNPYQTGWCGGIIAEYALLAGSDDEHTRARCREHLDNALSTGVSPSGLLYGKINPVREWCSDCWYEDGEFAARRNFTLTRRHADALFYALKACEIIDSDGQNIPQSWLDACRGIAERLCATWDEFGQWGHFLDQDTGAVCIGNSASGGLIPAGLLKAAERFGEDRYRRTALDGADYLYRNFTVKGVTTGGPGDAVQAPDSESSYALVESYWAVYRATGEKRWLKRTEEAVWQFASWIMPYDYPFPEGSLFGRLGMRTTGSIFANAQNCHLAPICTHSGRALFELSRETGDDRYMILLSQIARAIPQMTAREDRQIVSFDGQVLPSGWINERVNTSDWDRNVGGVFFGNTWCEVAMLLTAAELPGIYVRKKDGFICVLDNLEAEWVDAEKSCLRIHNKTKFDAECRLHVEGERKSRIFAIPAGDTTSENIIQ